MGEAEAVGSRIGKLCSKYISLALRPRRAVAEGLYKTHSALTTLAYKHLVCVPWI